jgi:hypothetical protein
MVHRIGSPGAAGHPRRFEALQPNEDSGFVPRAPTAWNIGEAIRCSGTPSPTNTVIERLNQETVSGDLRP